jgi:hypothetical protein
MSTTINQEIFTSSEQQSASTICKLAEIMENAYCKKYNSDADKKRAEDFNKKQRPKNFGQHEIKILKGFNFVNVLISGSMYPIALRKGDIKPLDSNTLILPIHDLEIANNLLESISANNHVSLAGMAREGSSQIKGLHFNGVGKIVEGHDNHYSKICFDSLVQLRRDSQYYLAVYSHDIYNQCAQTAPAVVQTNEVVFKEETKILNSDFLNPEQCNFLRNAKYLHIGSTGNINSISLPHISTKHPYLDGTFFPSSNGRWTIIADITSANGVNSTLSRAETDPKFCVSVANPFIPGGERNVLNMNGQLKWVLTSDFIGETLDSEGLRHNLDGFPGFVDYYRKLTANNLHKKTLSRFYLMSISGVTEYDTDLAREIIHPEYNNRQSLGQLERKDGRNSVKKK